LAAESAPLRGLFSLGPGVKADQTIISGAGDEPNSLRRRFDALPGFVRSTTRESNGKVVVVTHGPELRAFAKENYEKYQGIVDKLAELTKEGVAFRMCNNAMRAAGFRAEDMHGFVTIVPAGFAEIAYWPSERCCEALELMGWAMGFEPTTTGITIRDSTPELRPPSGWPARQDSNL